MKEIQGKIKFGVVPIYNGQIPNADGKIIINELSEITEEQAAEFVESDEKLNDEYFGDVCGYVNYCSSQNNWHPLSSAKESLISLLKSNDVWIKDWKERPNLNEFKSSPFCESGICKAYIDLNKDYEQLPDDLLLIKL